MKRKKMADTTSSLYVLAKRCQQRTIYDTNAIEWRDVSAEVKLLSTNLIVNNIIENCDDQTNRRAMEHEIDYILNNYDVPPNKFHLLSEFICPLSSLYSHLQILDSAIYDIDGCYFLLSRTEKNILSPLPVLEPCASDISMKYTCCPLNAISIDTLERMVYLPRKDMQDTFDKTIKNMIWMTKREEEINKTFRSPACCGPSMAAIITRRITTPFTEDNCPTNTMENRKPPSNTKKAKAPDYKWSGDMLRQTFSFLGSSDGGGGDDRNDHNVDDNNDVDNEKKKRKKRRKRTNDCNNDNDDGEEEEEEENDVIERIALHVQNVMKSDSRNKKRDQISNAINLEPETIPFYGDPRFNSKEYVIAIDDDNDEEDTQRNDDNVFIQKKDTYSSSIWTDLACSRRLRHILNESYPCVCSAEFITHLIVEQCNIAIATEQVGIFLIDHRQQQQQQQISNKIKREAINSFAVETACGTISKYPVFPEKFYNFVKTNKSLLLRIADNIGQVFALRNTFATTSTKLAPINKDVVINKASKMIHEWCELVERMKQDLIEQQRRSDIFVQGWYFARISSFENITTMIKLLCDQNDMHCRACDLMAATYVCDNNNSSRTKRRHDDNNIVVLKSPEAWPCDICWTFSLSTCALETLPNAVGIVVIGGGNDNSNTLELNSSKILSTSSSSRETITKSSLRRDDVTKGDKKMTMVVLPNRYQRNEMLSPFICGAMMHILGAFSGFRPFIMHQCITVYPFSAIILSFASTIATKSNDFGWKSIIRAAVAHLSDTCLIYWRKMMKEEEEKNEIYQDPEEIPRFACDLGAVSEEMITPTSQLRALERHEEIAIESLSKHIWNFFCKGIELLIPLWMLARAIVCVTRPFRKWYYTGSNNDNAVDLCQRTSINLEILDDDPQVEIYKTLRLMRYKTDNLVPVIRPRVMQRDFVGDGRDYYVTSDHCINFSSSSSSSYHNKEEEEEKKKQAANHDSPSAPLLFGLCQNVIPTKQFQDAIRIYRSLCLPDITIDKNSDESIFSFIIDDCQKGKLPIAELVCGRRSDNSNNILSAPEFIPIADNPMSLANSRPILCPSKQHMDSKYRKSSLGRCLLPKNSPLLCELMHHRYGLPILPNAWPDKHTLTNSVPSSSIIEQQYYHNVVTTLAEKSNIADDDDSVNHHLDRDTFETMIFKKIEKI